MDIELILDNREHKLIELLPNDTVAPLDIGDIQFRRGEETILIIERKSVTDLAASICDGRSREQKARLFNCGL